MIGIQDNILLDPGTTAWWFNFYVPSHAITMLNPVTLCPPARPLQCHWLCSLCCTRYLSACLFYNWKFVALISLHLFQPPTSPLEAIRLFCYDESVFVLLCVFLCCIPFSISHVSEVVQCRSFFAWLHLAWYTLEVHPCCYTWQDFVLFYEWVIVCCVCVCVVVVAVIWIHFLLKSTSCL